MSRTVESAGRSYRSRGAVEEPSKPLKPPRPSTRFSWTVADQALSSGTGALLSFAAAHSLSRQQFGTLSLVVSLWIVAAGLSRAAVSEPLVVSFSGALGRRWREAMAGALSAALLGGAFVGGVIVFVAPLVDTALRLPLVVLALALPGLFVQDAIRYTYFASGRPWGALLCDLAWVSALAAPALLLIETPQPTATQWLLVWGFGGYVAAALLLKVLRTGLSIALARSWWNAQAALAKQFGRAFLVHDGAVPAVAVGLAVLAGVSDVGSMRAAVVLLGPLTVVMAGSVSAATARAVGLVGAPAGVLDRFVVKVSVGLGLASTSGFALLLVPDDAGEVLLGATWEGARSVLVPTVALFVVTGLTAGPMVGLQALGHDRTRLGIPLVVTALAVVGGCVGAATTGASGAITGIALARLLGVPLWWRCYHRERRKRPVPTR